MKSSIKVFYIGTANTYIIDKLRNAYIVELFDVDGGINEHDIIYKDGLYHLFYSSTTLGLCHRQAAQLTGLASATPDVTAIELLYPTVVFDDGVWHMWGEDASHIVQHYESETPGSGWELQAGEDWGTAKYDAYVAKNPTTGKWYASHYVAGTLQMHVMSADAPGGEWTDMGAIFADKLAPWYSDAQYDTCLFFYQGKAFAMFVGYNAFQSSDGRDYAGIVELDTNTMLPKKYPVSVYPLSYPIGSLNLGGLIGDPTFIEPDKISTNFVNLDGDFAFGYLQLSKDLGTDVRTDNDIIRLRMTDGLNLANNILLNRHGTAVWSSDGLVCSATEGGAFGWPNRINLVNFILSISFTPAGTSGDYDCIFDIGRGTRESQPQIQIQYHTNKARVNIAGNSGAYVELLSGDLTIGTKYTVEVVKSGTTITATINGVALGAGTGELGSGDITLMDEFSIANTKSIVKGAYGQFNGTIHSLVMVEET